MRSPPSWPTDDAAVERDIAALGRRRRHRTGARSRRREPRAARARAACVDGADAARRRRAHAVREARPIAWPRCLAARAALLTPHPAEFARISRVMAMDDVLAKRFDVGGALAQATRRDRAAQGRADGHHVAEWRATGQRGGNAGARDRRQRRRAERNRRNAARADRRSVRRRRAGRVRSRSRRRASPVTQRRCARHRARRRRRRAAACLGLRPRAVALSGARRASGDRGVTTRLALGPGAEFDAIRDAARAMGRSRASASATTRRSIDVPRGDHARRERR